MHEMRHVMANIDATKRPVIGIMTEPLRGDLYSDQTADSRNVTYVPKTHV